MSCGSGPVYPYGVPYPYPYAYPSKPYGWTPPITLYGGGWSGGPGGGCYNGWSQRQPECPWWIGPGNCNTWALRYPYAFGGCCPKAVVGGACCDGCASGGGCDGCGTPVVSALTVSSEERNEFGTAITQFASDAAAAEQVESEKREAEFAQIQGMKACFAAGLKWGGSQCVQEPDPTHASYPSSAQVSFAIRQFIQNDLNPFILRWQDYNTSLTATTAVPAFEELKMQFAQMVSDWKTKLGQKTSAVPPTVTKGGIPSDLGKGVGEAAKGIAKFGTYALAIGALGVGAYFLGPPLVAAVLRRRKK